MGFSKIIFHVGNNYTFEIPAQKCLPPAPGPTWHIHLLHFCIWFLLSIWYLIDNNRVCTENFTSENPLFWCFLGETRVYRKIW